MSAMLSPAVYLRCSENSTENPWNGLACRPLRNPSTMNLARRSSRATWRITSGRRYFSALAMRNSPQRHKGHKEDKKPRSEDCHEEHSYLVFCLLCALCALCAFVVNTPEVVVSRRRRTTP